MDKEIPQLARGSGVAATERVEAQDSRPAATACAGLEAPKIESTMTLIEKLTKTSEGMRLYQQERAIQELGDLICEVMCEQHVTRADLAKRLGCTRGNISHLLDGRANMTVQTISDVFTALGHTVHFNAELIP